MMKEIDLTYYFGVPIIGEKQKWLFKCNRCGYEAMFILSGTTGMSTGCEICFGDMERQRKVV